MSGTDDAFEIFRRHWESRCAEYHLDDPQVREDVMSLVCSLMVTLAYCSPEVFETFMAETSKLLDGLMPADVKQHVFEVVKEGK